MKIPIYQIDAFTGKRFHGNPAAVCPLNEWLPDATLQDIAAENNLAETAFVVAKGGVPELRWFTPELEVDLCGHATLATAFVFKEYLNYARDEISFRTKSGILKVEYAGDMLSMVFPRKPGELCAAPDNLADALKVQPREVLKAADLMVVISTEDEVRRLKPDINKLKSYDFRGIIVTAKGNDVDFVSRFFAPRVGIAEDPVTGSSHVTLVPYWAQRLRKNNLTALQVSKRGGELFCEDMQDKVKIAGRAVSYLAGEIDV